MRQLYGRGEDDRAYDRRRRRTPGLALAARIRASRRWKKVRAATLRERPLCQPCARLGVRQLATQVDHIEPLQANPARAFDPENLEPVCTRCHARKSAAERRAEP